MDKDVAKKLVRFAVFLIGAWVATDVSSSIKRRRNS